MEDIDRWPIRRLAVTDFDERTALTRATLSYGAEDVRAEDVPDGYCGWPTATRSRS